MDSMKRKRLLSPSPSSSSTHQWKYEVFLSFRGEDTRNNFTDHLYDALNRSGIITFRDEEGLERGKSISNLFKAIEESQFAIIILSKNYASSKWCLDELAKIVKCSKERGLIILPVFYDVDPSDVRNQTGTFKQAFIDHQKCFEDNIEKVETWRAALREVAGISGWHLQNRHESEFIQCIVKKVMEKLRSKSSSTTNNFIGMESIVAEMIPLYLGFENNVYMIGIYGMGGIGKTTLARVIYDKFRDYFEGSSFIANVREDSQKHGLPRLQKQLLVDILKNKEIDIPNVYDGVDMIKKMLRLKRVLLVIDDVNHLDQLENLVGEENWFGLGSWIIITTRDERVLVQHGVLKRYKPEVLKNDDALNLFCLKAFKMEQPKEGYVLLSQKVVKYANGLPLALVTLGSYLVERSIDEWKSALNSFKRTKGEIFDILKISYDGLEEMWKEIFLDIACFFRGIGKEKVIEILKDCGFDARIGISVLEERSLLTMDGNKCLMMHDLLQEMGEKIVCPKPGENLEKQSRLWRDEDLLRVLEDNMATGAIQAIVVNGCGEDFNLENFSEGFSKMSNLRLLIIKRMGYLNDQRHLALPNNLRYLQWHSCPFKCLASSHKQRMEFVHLDLHHGNFEYLWEGVMLSKNLKHIDLGHSYNLIRTPDFSGVPNLEELRLSHCYRLVEIHPSIGQLSRLRYLDPIGCGNLTDLPCMSAVMQSLTVLNLSLCSKISLFPKFTGIMKSLSELKLSRTAIEKVEPSSIECLTALAFLDLSACRKLECLPSNMDNLKSLETLKLSDCRKLKSLPRLPSTVRFVDTKGCFSLKWSPKRVKLSIWSQPFSQWLPYDESGSRVGFTVLFHFLEGRLRREDVLDGSIIPSCLAEIKETSISIELPSNWYNNKWIGFALWASVSYLYIPLISYENRGIRASVIALGNIPQNYWAFEQFTASISEEKGICLLYLSRADWFAKVGNGECSQIKVIFETLNSIMGGVCGVSLIYKQGVDEFNETNAQCLIKSFGEEVCIYKLTAGDDDDDVHIVEDDDDDDDDVHIVHDDDDVYDDIHDGDVKKVVDDDFHDDDA